MRRKLAFLLTALIVIVALSACDSRGASTRAAAVTAQSSEPAATASPTPSPVPTLTETPPSTPTAAPTVGPSLTPVPTPVFGSARVGNDFLFGNQPEGCELPCWQGLRIGKSDTDDIQAMFDTAFGFNGSYEFLERLREGKIPDLLITHHGWNFDTSTQPGESSGSFNIAIHVHKGSQLLEAIEFQGVSTNFRQYTNPQSILRALGEPSMMLIVMSGSENPQEGVAGLTTAYEEGIIITYLAIRAQYDTSHRGTVCLGSRPNTNYYHVEVILTEPIPDDLSGLSPVQDALFGQLITTSEHYRPFEEIFGIGLEEITTIAQQPGDMCISTKMPSW